MWSTWYTENVVPFVAAEFPAATGMTEDNYFQVAFKISVGRNVAKTPAGMFITALRTDKKMAMRLRDKWRTFEEKWMPEHLLNHTALEAHLRKVIEEKDVWIAINNKGAHWIEGFRVTGLRYIKCAKKAQGGCVYHYVLLLQKKSGGEIREVPIIFKFNWKNGGQAVQNPNFMIG